MKIGIASDHGGFELKEYVVQGLWQTEKWKEVSCAAERESEFL